MSHTSKGHVYIVSKVFVVVAVFYVTWHGYCGHYKNK